MKCDRTVLDHGVGHSGMFRNDSTSSSEVRELRISDRGVRVQGYIRGRLVGLTLECDAGSSGPGSDESIM